MNPTDNDPIPWEEFMDFCCSYYALHRGFPKAIRDTLGANILEEISEAKRLAQHLADSSSIKVAQCRKMKMHAQQFVTHLDNLLDILFQAWSQRLISHADMAMLELRLSTIAKRTPYWQHAAEC